MNAVSDTVINEVFRAIAMVFALILGGSVVVSGYDAWGMMAEFMANGCP